MLPRARMTFDANLSGRARLTEAEVRLNEAEVRLPAVAGLFYPDSGLALARGVTQALDSVAVPEAPPDAGVLRAVVAPHAGYRYSGKVAAHAFAHLRSQSRRAAPSEAPIVFLLGPNHRVHVSGFALPGAGWLRTPLGDSRVDPEIEGALLENEDVVQDARAHEREHSLEVLVPFVQSIWGREARIVPLLVGRAEADRVCEVLEPFWDRDDVRFVFSSDLSHFLDEESAKRRDANTSSKLIEAKSSDLGPEEACGARGLNGLTLMANQRRMLVQELDRRTSADAGGDPRRVVGYAALAYWDRKGPAPS